MRVVAAVDEAGQTPQAAEGTQQTTEHAQVDIDAARRRTAGDGQPPTDPTMEQAAGQAPATTPPGTEPAPEQARSESEQAPQTPGFGERGRMRRRARFLRKARELAYRDLGGLVFDLHRFGQRNDQLVLAKLATLRQIDTEVRELEGVLRERRPVTVLREVGIAACPRCAAIHGSDDRFCPGCGLAFDTNADRPISTAPMGVAQQASQPTSGLAQQAPQPISGAAQQASQPTSGAAQRQSAPGRPNNADSPAPPRPTAAPVAARPGPEQPRPEPPAPEQKKPVKEDEPTQILRPPTGGE